MDPIMRKFDLSYPAILKLLGDYKMKGRKPSRAFIAWFLETYYRLDAIEVDDAICDECGDKGIDAIYVSELWQQIHVFGCRMFEKKKSANALGDTELKELLGTLTQLKDENAARQLQTSTDSEQLRRLMQRLEIPKLVGEGYEVRGIFVTNRPRGKHAEELLASNPNLQLYDSQKLTDEYLPIDKAEPIADRVVALWEIRKVVLDELSKMDNRPFASYSQTPFLVLYLLRELLETRESGGMSLCRDQSMFVSKLNGRARLAHSIGPTVKCVVNNLGAYLQQHGPAFDYKKDLKSGAKTKEISAQVTAFYRQCLASKYVRPFNQEWDESANIKIAPEFSGELPLE